MTSERDSMRTDGQDFHGHMVGRRQGVMQPKDEMRVEIYLPGEETLHEVGVEPGIP